MEIQSLKSFPASVDINPTARCNLRCSFCWGPDHDIPDALTLSDWKDALSFLAENGTKGIVVTGGEPLIREDLGEILDHAKRLGLRITLSTNCLLLRKRHESILPYVDDLGIPLDGPTPETNRLMRIGDPRAFVAAVAAMPLVRAVYPSIKITVRTVVSRVNVDQILPLAELLAGIPELFDRWKLYQFSPFSIGANHATEHNVDTATFLSVINDVVKIGAIQNRTEWQSSASNVGRYVFVGPQGLVYGVNGVGRYEFAGHILSSDKEQLAQRMAKLADEKLNAVHATAK